MFYFCVTLFFLLIIFNIISTKKLTLISNLFLAYWILSLMAYKFGNIEFFEISNHTYLIIAVTCVAFWGGSFIARVIHKKFNDNIKRRNKYLNFQLLKMFIIIHFGLTIYYFAQAMTFLFQGFDFRTIRSIYQGYIENVHFVEGRFEGLILHWIVMPLGTLIPLLVIVLYFCGVKMTKMYRIVFLDMVMQFGYTQSRFYILYIIIIALSCLFLYRQRISYKKLQKFNYLMLGSIILIIMFTIVRFSGSRWSGLKSFILYLGGPIALLDRNVDIIDEMGYQFFGQNFIYGWLVSVRGILRIVGIDTNWFPSQLEMLNNGKEIYQHIGPHVWFNAFYTVFYDFYIDFHLIGNLIGGFSFGFFAEYYVQRMLRDKDDVNAVCYGIISIYVVIISIVRWQFTMYSFCFAFIYFFFIKKIKICIKGPDAQ